MSLQSQLGMMGLAVLFRQTVVQQTSFAACLKHNIQQAGSQEVTDLQHLSLLHEQLFDQLGDLLLTAILALCTGDESSVSKQQLGFGQNNKSRKPTNKQ